MDELSPLVLSIVKYFTILQDLYSIQLYGNCYSLLNVDI